MRKTDRKSGAAEMFLSRKNGLKYYAQGNFISIWEKL